MNIHREFVVALSILCFPTLVDAQAIDLGTNTDQWDVFRGASIIRTSGGSVNFAPENAFGAKVPTVPGNPIYDFIFQDGQPSGFVHFVEWRTPAPVTIKSFRLFAQGDGSFNDNGREFERFVLKSKSVGSDSFNNVLYDFTTKHPYTFLNEDQRLVLAANVKGIVAQEFRAEFTDRGNRFFSGPRVIELDGFVEQFVLDIHPAVEVSWATEVGRRYQVQFSTDVVNPNWTNFGPVIVGDGSPKSLFDTTRLNDAKTIKYYRLVEVFQ